MQRPFQLFSRLFVGHFALAAICISFTACKGGEPKPVKAASSAAVATTSGASPTPPSAAGSADYVPPPTRSRPLGAVGVQGTEEKPQPFGAPIQRKDVTPLTRVLAESKKYAEQTIQVEGLVRRACSRKGCWMELATAESGPACRVTFQDYGFFVPTDAAGAKARLEAVVKLETLPPNQVRHHEREGATFPDKNPDGSANEVRLVASGVELWH